MRLVYDGLPSKQILSFCVFQPVLALHRVGALSGFLAVDGRITDLSEDGDPEVGEGFLDVPFPFERMAQHFMEVEALGVCRTAGCMAF